MVPPPAVADIDSVIDELWSNATNSICAIHPATENWKAQVLPLARIKKIMKSEEWIYAELMGKDNKNNNNNNNNDNNSCPPQDSSCHNTNKDNDSTAKIELPYTMFDAFRNRPELRHVSFD
mmetsp:Transcript_9103/g.8701  ORF Transcript_9103/g.8701 Transcript_9103/m.8701 type:complete len:121 (-) Transcript_9103:47-409(-)